MTNDPRVEFTTDVQSNLNGEFESLARKAGEPYSRVKEKARYMAQSLWDDGYKQGHFLVDTLIEKLIESAPQQTLQALCDVLDPDATTS